MSDHFVNTADAYCDGVPICMCPIDRTKTFPVLAVITDSAARALCPACRHPVLEPGDAEDALYTRTPIPMTMTVVTAWSPARIGMDGVPEPPEPRLLLELSLGLPELCELPHLDIEEEDACDELHGVPANKDGS